MPTLVRTLKKNHDTVGKAKRTIAGGGGYDTNSEE
jgi:hypothetical protein